MSPATRSKALALRAQERHEIARRSPSPRQVITALTHLREARLELLAAFKITAANDVEALIRRIEAEA